MKILMIHNKYVSRGGEDTIFEQEKKLLLAKGHKIISYTRDNAEIESYNFIQKIKFAFSMIFSLKTYFELTKVIKHTTPEIAYIHNDFPLISPSAYFACNLQKIPIIKRIPNYRLFCSNGFFVRENEVCEKCLVKNNPFISVKYGCYRNSKLLTFLVASMIRIHRNTYRERINYLLPNSPIVKEKLLKGKFIRTKLIVKSNFTEGKLNFQIKKENFAIYVGRLSKEKGLKSLSEAWRNIDFKLEVYGDGPLRDLIKNQSNVIYKGPKSNVECLQRIKKAKFLIFPSIHEETFGISMIEAFSVGTPVLASRMGNMKYVVEDGKTGKFFNPGDSEDLREKALWMINHTKECEQMGKNAYLEYKEKYTPDVNYKNLMSVFNKAINDAKNR
jgi:glycosyltransferase involved in cell wall biosynthesis